MQGGGTSIEARGTWPDSRLRSQRGMLLIWVLISGVMLLGLIYSGNLFLQASALKSKAGYHSHAQAVDVARAGLVDAHAWFRRQAGQPVTSFAPVRDMASVPPVDDTDDPTIGLVREFEVTPGLVGRYEIRIHEDLDSSGTHDPGEGVADVSAQRSLPGLGSVWHLESWGFVYRRIDPAKAWNEDPNYRVAGALISTEIRRTPFSPPGDAALSCARGDAVTVGSKGLVHGHDATGIAYAPGTGFPSTPGQVEGEQETSGIPGYDGSADSVFGVDLADLRSMATVHLGSSHPMPSPVPQYSLVFVDGDRNITLDCPLKGTGVVVVDGNLTIEAGSNTYFSGMIYVTGNFVQRAPSLIRGVVIVEGTASISGSGDKSELHYDEEILEELRLRTGGYRISRPILRLDDTYLGGPR